MKLRIFILAALFLGVSANAWAAKPIENIVDKPVPAKLDGSGRQVEEVRDAIVNGCRAKGWTPVMDGDSQIKCSITVRGKHFVEVNIPFTESQYSILYSDSRVMDYDAEKQRIHRNYNRWIILLSDTIQRQFTY